MARAGFTLVELLIVLAIVLLILSLTGTIATNTYPKSQLRANAGLVAQTLREARSYTIARRHESVWGVHLTATDMTLFAGGSYETRNTSYDQVHAFPSGITVSGLNDVVFDALLGTTSQAGTITLTSSATGESMTITVNAQGNVSL